MIKFNITGRLGNAMFIIATGEYWRSLGYDVVYNDTEPWLQWIKGKFNNVEHVEEYKTIFPNFDFQKYANKETFAQKRVPFRYTPITPEDGIEYVGYFQSEKNFPNRELIETLFEPSREIREYLIMNYGALILKYKTCSIHVRRDDYLTSQGQHPVCDIEYYHKAIETLKPFNVERFLVFSDDLPWCKENFTGERFVFIDEKDYISLILMARCDHSVIANSSFSWWGAWLGETLDTVVIAPRHWFGDDKPKDFDADIKPQRWIQL